MNRILFRFSFAPHIFGGGNGMAGKNPLNLLSVVLGCAGFLWHGLWGEEKDSIVGVF